jgi:glutathione S-transferase
LAQRNVGFPLGEAELAYVARTTGREGYKRTMEACHDTREWAARVASR